MTILLESSTLDAIAAIGEDRRPNEACGLLIPLKDRLPEIRELPNRSKYPHDSFEMRGQDIFLTLQSVFGEDLTMDDVEEIITEIAVWHTHPEGNIGPSRADIRNKPARFMSLVVTLRESGPPVATWF